MVSLAADVYAIQALAKHWRGDLLMAAWLKTGYIRAKELAELRFGGDEAARALRHVVVHDAQRQLGVCALVVEPPTGTLHHAAGQGKAGLGQGAGSPRREGTHRGLAATTRGVELDLLGRFKKQVEVTAAGVGRMLVELPWPRRI